MHTMGSPFDYNEDERFVDDTVRQYETRTNTKKLQKLAQEVDTILKEELKRDNIKYTFAEARIIDAKTVGVQGDERTFGYPAEITLYYRKRFVWPRRKEFLERLSNRITNEVKDVNRVMYTLKCKDRSV